MSLKKLLLLLGLQAIGGIAVAQKLSYEVSFPNIVHHEARIALSVTDVRDNNLVFRMSRSSPGRYATHEFGKNIYDVTAEDKTGKALPIQRLDGDVYKVSGISGFAKVTYTLYANHADGTYAGLDETNAHFNMPAAFIWVKGLENAPISIKFNIPDGKKWEIATQLKPTADAVTFTAPNLQYFMDSPTKLGSLNIKEWTLPNPGGKQSRFRVALEAAGSDSLATAFAGKVKKVTQEAQAVYGEFPAFDVGNYTFIASINPYVKGDGMEHRNSTMIAVPITFTGSDNLLGVFSHEFFHTWNVERIRPKTLEPFNFEKSNMSFDLWFAEGFTQYYGDLLLERAGFDAVEDYCQTLTYLVNTKENTEGAKRISPVQASCQAVFVDAGVAVDKTNYPNTFTSYYPYGGAIALALDLKLREKGLTLDGFMKAAWLKHGKPEIPYTVSDLQIVLENYSKDKTFAADFFRKYINGHEPLDYAPLLQKAGISVKKQFEGQAWLGDLRYKEGSELTILSNTIINTPLYNAGLDIDDQILKLDGKPVGTQTALAAILAAHKPGDQVTVDFKHRDITKSASVTLGESQKLIVQTNEKLNIPVTDAMKKFRQDWLGSRIVQ